MTHVRVRLGMQVTIIARSHGTDAMTVIPWSLSSITRPTALGYVSFALALLALPPSVYPSKPHAL